MPLYEYQCESCGSTFTKLVKSFDVAAPICESCNKPMKKLLSQTSFVLKGGGWFADGYTDPGSNAAGNR